MMVGAVLTQNTAWANVERALTNMKAAGALSPTALRERDIGELAILIRPSGYFNAKARKLRALGFFLREYDDDIPRLFRSKPLDKLRSELLGVFGIGPETADSMLLYAGELPIFVIDAYTIRFLERIGTGDQKFRYESAQTLFHADKALVPELHYAEFHALLVAHGKNTCRARNPLCIKCPVLDNCHTGQKSIKRNLGE
jgi:endonuclease-3 related protein